MAMLDQYRASGGLASSTEVEIWLERELGKQAQELPRWRAQCQVVCFEWRDLLWLPRFQFAQKQLLPNPAVCVLLAELSQVLTEGEMAQWCGAPNPALGHRAPADVLDERPLAVFTAAVFDRLEIDT